MRKNLFTTATLAAVLALSACSGDGDGGTGPGGDGTLSAAEIAQLNQAILSMSADVGSQRGALLNAAPTGQGTGSLTVNFDETAPCQPRGNVTIAGTMNVGWDDAAQTGTITTDFAVDHDACAHRLEDGQVITLTGDPDIDVRMDMATGPQGLTSFTIRETGAFNWSKDGGNSGRCTLDVTAQLNVTTGAVALSGSFCGFPVTGTFQED